MSKFASQYDYFKANSYSENSLLGVQKNFFTFLCRDLIFGEHNQKKPAVSIDFTRDINELAFETIGKFRLIDEDAYGDEFRYYVPINEDDNAFDVLTELDKRFKNTCDVPKKEKDFKKIMSAKFAVEEHLKLMSNQIVQIRLKKSDVAPLSREIYNDLCLIGLEDV
ncbi:hypothetical protein [Emticicia sp. SJ17W-69]|uniref:hypothetical protein n=1 Tax=Emticicia sp. SJ17W-69 TaxID=3421657 RepID=UPI003EBC3761